MAVEEWREEEEGSGIFVSTETHAELLSRISKNKKQRIEFREILENELKKTDTDKQS